jgi:hypothetical protein
VNKEELYKEIWRYGTMLKDIEYNTIRITIWSYNDKLWYIHMDAGMIIECHELKP